jgi:hypothetical protein
MIFCDFWIKIKIELETNKNKRKKLQKDDKGEIWTQDLLLATICTLYSLPNELSHILKKKWDKTQYNKSGAKFRVQQLLIYFILLLFGVCLNFIKVLYIYIINYISKCIKSVIYLAKISII